MRVLVAARLVGQFGDRFTLLALPLFAVSAAGADTAGAALLFTVYALPGVAAAALGPRFDRSGRLRTWCAAADFGRSALLVAIVTVGPVAGLPLVLLLTFACGCLAVVFDVGLQTHLPRAVPRAGLSGANAWFARAQALADVVGPPAAGAVVALAGSRAAIGIDAATFLVSGALLLLVQDRPAPPVVERDRAWAAGVRHLLAVPLLRSVVGVMLVVNLGGAMIGALWVVYATESLGLQPAVLGVVTAAGGISAVVGSAVVGRLATALGTQRSLVLGFAVAAAALLCVPAAAIGAPVALLAAFQVAFSASAVVVAVNAATLRQLSTPADLQGQVFSVIRSAQDVVLPVGGAVAAAVAATAGATTAVLAGAVAAMVAIPATVLVARADTGKGAAWQTSPADGC